MIIIREAKAKDPPRIAKVHVDSWKTTYAGIVPDGYLASLSYQQREKMWRTAISDTSGRKFVYVAEASNSEIIGFVAGGPERSGKFDYEGELYAIYLYAENQRQGVGRQLTVALTSRLLQIGINSMLVWVLAENPANRFYQALGGKPVAEQEIEIGDSTLLEIAYGWKDIHMLTSSTA